jgi:hypothetical protein
MNMAVAVLVHLMLICPLIRCLAIVVRNHPPAVDPGAGLSGRPVGRQCHAKV